MGNHSQFTDRDILFNTNHFVHRKEQDSASSSSSSSTITNFQEAHGYLQKFATFNVHTPFDDIKQTSPVRDHGFNSRSPTCIARTTTSHPNETQDFLCRIFICR